MPVPLTREQFLEDFWERTPAFVRGSPRTYVNLQFGLNSFLNSLRTLSAAELKAHLVAPNGECRNIAIDPSQARYCYDAGMTICASRVDRHHASLAAVAKATKLDLKLAGDVFFNSYLSPAGTGFGMHFDAQSVMICQIEGSKRWRYSTGPALRFPPENLDAEPRRISEYRARFPCVRLLEPGSMPFVERILHQGDLLYLPAGTWHQAFAGGAYSLGLTLTCVSGVPLDRTTADDTVTKSPPR